jgi:hypothetical protein
MGKKAEKKKKKYQAECQQLVKEGKVNIQDGTWRGKADPIFARMEKDLRAGYHLG